jgi:hypothetical protein
MADINKSGYKVSKSGGVRQAGQLPAGDASTGRGSTARAGTLASDNTASGDRTGPYAPAFSEGGLGKMPQKFRPTPGRGKVK